jgi:type IV pilus assembly protein PilA
MEDNMFTKFNTKEGFTLIELMIVIAIIGILAAIAIPQFSAYRKRAYNSAAESDVRNIATAQEAYYVDNSSYANDINNITGSAYGYYPSGKVSAAVGGSTDGYTITAIHSAGDKTYSLAGPGGTVTTAP